MEEIRQLLTSETPVKWLFYGDSITHGALHTFGRRDYVELFAERLRFELARTMDVVINTAISGHTTRQLLDGFDWRVAQFKPDVVFIMIGMNDSSDANDITAAEFEGNLGQLVDRIESFGGRTVLATTCPILPNTSPEREPHFPSFMEAVRTVSHRRRLPLIDHLAYWEQNADRHYYWMSNAFHPNAEGHLAFAHLLFRELGILDPASASCRFFLP